MERPAVSVIVPFHGTAVEAARTMETMTSINSQNGDETIVVDDTPNRVLAGVELPDGFRTVATGGRQSSYTARNAGALAARNEWLLFVDADTSPDPDLLDLYLEQPPDERTAALAGGILPDPNQNGTIARYTTSRGHIDPVAAAESAAKPYAVTANLLVRRKAWEEVGGFQSGIRSNGDVDFSFRIQDAGWTLEQRPTAQVSHRHREDLRALLRQVARYSAGNRWFARRRPGAFPARSKTRAVARAVVGTAWWTVVRQPERARFKAIDGLVTLAQAVGTLAGNTSPPRPPASAEVSIAGIFPEPGANGGTWTEALARPDRPALPAPPAAYLEDDGQVEQLQALLGLLMRRPTRVLRAARHRDGARPLYVLAPSAWRIVDSGASTLLAEPGREADAQRLGLLAGATVETTSAR